MKTHYDVLKIAPDAPVEVIHAVYKALNEEYAQNASQADDIANLNAAYAVLSELSSRKRYDESLFANAEPTKTPEIESPEIKISAVSLNKSAQTKNKKFWILGTLAITAMTVSSLFVLVKKYDVVELVKTKLSDATPASLSNNKINEPVTQEAFVNPVDTKLDQIQPKVEPETKADIDVKQIEFDKLLAEEKAKNEALIKEIEAQKETKKIELKQLATTEKSRHDALTQELEIQKLEQEEKAKQIELQQLAESKTKQAEIDRLLAAEKVRADVATKQEAILQSQEKAITAIQQKVNQHWKNLLENADFSLLNPEAVSKFKCTMTVSLSPEGKVLDVITQKSSDYAGFDQTAEKAINSASPFSIPENQDVFEKKFKTLSFVFERNAVSMK